VGELVAANPHHLCGIVDSDIATGQPRQIRRGAAPSNPKIKHVHALSYVLVNEETFAGREVVQPGIVRGYIGRVINLQIGGTGEFHCFHFFKST
jgi:hypothetical protein